MRHGKCAKHHLLTTSSPVTKVRRTGRSLEKSHGPGQAMRMMEMDGLHALLALDASDLRSECIFLRM